MTKAAVNEVPVIGVSVTEQIGKRAIVLQSHVASDMTDEEINKFLDLVMSFADRQKLYYETREGLFELRANLERHETSLQDMVDDLNRTDAKMKAEWVERGRQGDFKLTQAQKAHRDNILKNEEAFKVNIGRLKTAIKDNEAILANIGR